MIKKSQQGAALYIVVVLILLSMLVALWASRSAIFNELTAGNDADYQRAFEAAQAMTQDAQDDLYRHLYDSSKTKIRTSAQMIPAAAADLNANWLMSLSTQPQQCLYALCLRRGVEDFWSDPTSLEAMLALGARYGQYSGAKISGSNTITPPNPILNFTDTNKGAWYWIEPLSNGDYASKEAFATGNLSNLTSGTIAPVSNTDMLYRITALAFGIKGSSSSTAFKDHSPTMAVIQTIISFPSNTGE